MQTNNRYRPVYHASVRQAWSNDPNGMIFYKGRAHLFFQHYPHEAQWGPMHWGHFSTKDFIRWEEHPVALVPDKDYEAICGCCSGNAFEKDGKLWLMYTAAQPELQRQCLAFSEDGIHFTKLDRNPVLTADMLSEEVSPRDFRDPKILVRDGWFYCLAGTRIIDPILYKQRVERLFKEEQYKNNPSRQTEEVLEDEEVVVVKDRHQDVNPSRGNHLASTVPVLGGDDRGALGNGNMILFRTKDFKDFTYCGKLFRKQEEFDDRFFTLNGVYECPDYFVSNDTEILLASPQNLPQMGHRFQNIHSVLYMTGHLDFETGHFQISTIEDLDSGFDIYAPQVVNLPDGRHIMIAWKEMWDRPYPTKADNWVGSYTLPRELSYENGHLYQRPVREIEGYRRNKVSCTEKVIKDTSISIDGFSGKSYEIKALFDPGDAKKLGLKLFKGTKHETRIFYDVEEGDVVFDRENSGIPLKAEGDLVRRCDVGQVEKICLRVFADVSSIEVFIDDGRYVMTGNVYPDQGDRGIEFFAEGGQCILLSAEKHDICV